MRTAMKRLMSMRTLLLLLLTGTVAFYILFPRYLYRGEYFETSVRYTPIQSRNYILLPNMKRQVVVSFLPRPYGLKMHVLDLQSGYEPEMTINDLTGDVLPYWDEQDQCIYLVQRQRNTDLLVLLKIQVDEELHIETERNYLWSDPLLREVRDTTLVLRETTLLRPRLRQEGQPIGVKKETDGWRLAFAGATADTLKILWPQYLERYGMLDRAADSLRSRTGKSFVAADVYRLLQTFRRNAWYRQRHIDTQNELYVNYGVVRVIDRCDVNGDGNLEMLFLQRGDRYLEYTLYCWDPMADSLLWKWSTTGGPVIHFIADVDGDGRDELGIGNYAPGCQLSPTWLDHPEVGVTTESAFFLLDDDGSVFQWEEKRAVEPMGGYGSRTWAHYFPQENAALLMSFTDMDNGEKPYKRIDLTTGIVDTLDMTYVNIRECYDDDEGVVLWDIRRNTLRRLHWTSTTNSPRYKDYAISMPISRNMHDPLTIDGKPYTLVSPLNIVDENFRDVYTIPVRPIKQLSARPDTLFFIKADERPKGPIGILTLHRNTMINPVAPLLVGFLLVLLVIHWLVSSFIMAPIMSGDKGYIVLWSLLGRLYLWRPLGKATIYRLPRYIAFDKRYFTSAIGKMASDYRCIFQRKLLLLDFSVYELERVDELAIVQHIAHELKNRMHVLQLSWAGDDEESQKRSNSLRWATRAARIISDFSRVHMLDPKPNDLWEIVRDTSHTLMGHARFDQLELTPPSSPFVVPADSQLLGMALRNLIENALQAIEDDCWVRVDLDRTGGKAVVTVRNPGHIPPDKLERILNSGGWSSKPEGTGVGVSVARVIVENHGGNLTLESHDDVVEARLSLPLVTEKTASSSMDTK